MAEPAQPAGPPGEPVDPPPTSAGEPTEDPAGCESAAKKLRHALGSALSTTDVTVRRLDTLLSTAAGQESVLAAINYSSHALHYLLASAAVAALRTRLRRLLFRAARSKAAAPDVPSSSPSSPSKPPLLALSSLISETRYTLRLFGLLPLWTWGSATLRAPPADPVIRNIVLLQVLVNVLYQALENVAYLASKGVLPKRIVDRWGGVGKWYLWSTRAWLGHVVLEFARLARESAITGRNEQEGLQNKKKQLTDEDREARRLEIRRWRKKLVNNLCWAPLCVHWSLEQGAGVPDSLTGFISLLAGVWGLYDSWKATAASA
ncbi:hypothetical protein VTN02DRAFT_5438 [Thermoascus thermophilus]